ncbi:unnamed protein product, partial [Rotaria magnacalcarata]
MSIVKSSKNKDQLLLDGYRYRRANKCLVVWRCCKNNCAGRVRFDGAEYIKVTEHFHAPNPEEIISMEFKSNITSGATTSHDPPRRIIHQALLNVNKNNGSAVPNYSSNQRTIERRRKKQDIPIPTPITFTDINIPDELRTTNNGDRFLLYDNGDSSRRIIILSPDEDLDRLSNSEHWHCDGTFKLCPQLFYQLYTIHGHLCGRSLPLVYCYVAGKDEDTYGEIFDIILKNLSQRPKSITIDFEKAVENVVRQQLPMTTIGFCFFHFKKALWKQIQTRGLQQLFLENHEARHYLKNFACLTFIPEQFVIIEFERLQADAPDSINDFIDYYEGNFIGRPIRNNRRRQPRYAIAMWNCYLRLDQQLPRTNNSSEGWHRALQHSARSHPTIYESIKDLKMEQHATSIMAEQLQAGLMKLRRRVKYE